MSEYGWFVNGKFDIVSRINTKCTIRALCYDIENRICDIMLR